MTSQNRRAALIGASAAIIVFAALRFAQAFGQQAFEVPTIAADPAKFYGREISVTGVARSIHQSMKYSGKERIPVVKLMLYEIIGGKAGKRYVSATVPSSQFRYAPRVDEIYSVSGVFVPPANVGSIGE